MKTRHLTRRGDVYVFQIRIPKRLNIQCLSPIRVPLGPIGSKQAQSQADILAGFARAVFERRARPMDVADRQALMESLSPDMVLEAMVPMLGSLDTLLDGDLDEDIGDQVRDATMTTMAAIGIDRVLGKSLTYHFMGDRLQSLMARTLTDDSLARAVYGLPDRRPTAVIEPDIDQSGEGVPDPMQELGCQSLNSTTSVQIGCAATELNESPSIPLFSEATALLAREVAAERNNENDPEVATINRVAEYFIALCGDRPVDRYSFTIVQEYVNDLAYIQPNAFKKDAKLKPGLLREHVANCRKLSLTGLSRSTIRNTYLDRVRRIIHRGCIEGEIANKLKGANFRVPKRALKSRSRPVLPLEKILRVFDAGIESGVLSDVLLPLLGWITGRRIGLLAQIQTDWIQFENGVWVVKPQWTVDPEDPDDRIGLKTEASLKTFVLHRVLEDIGFIDWVKSLPPGQPLFEVLSRCADPEDAAQKRMGRLFSSTGLSKKKMETFHALRGTWIADKSLKLDPRIRKIQVGHELTDIHDLYNADLSPEEMRLLYAMPLPDEFDPSIFKGIDFEAASKRVPRGGRRAKKTVRLPVAR